MNPAPCPSFHVDVFIIQLKLEMGQTEISREGCGIVKYPKMRNWKKAEGRMFTGCKYLYKENYWMLIGSLVKKNEMK